MNTGAVFNDNPASPQRLLKNVCLSQLPPRRFVRPFRRGDNLSQISFLKFIDHINYNNQYDCYDCEDGHAAHILLELLPLAQLFLHFHNLRFGDGDVSVDEVRHFYLCSSKRPNTKGMVQQAAAPLRPAIAVRIGQERRGVSRGDAVLIRNQPNVHRRVMHHRAVHPHRLHGYVPHLPARRKAQQGQYIQ